MQRKQKGRGSAMVELALLTPLMVLLLLGGIHFGNLFYTYNSLEKSVRDGARYAATRTFTNKVDYDLVIKNVVLYGDPQSNTTQLDPGLLKTNVSVEESPMTGRPERIKVYVSSYRYQGVFGTFTFTNKPTMEVPFLGRYMPQPHVP